MLRAFTSRFLPGARVHFSQQIPGGKYPDSVLQLPLSYPLGTCQAAFWSSRLILLPSSRVQGLPVLPILANTYYCLSFY